MNNTLGFSWNLFRMQRKVWKSYKTNKVFSFCRTNCAREHFCFSFPKSILVRVRAPWIVYKSLRFQVIAVFDQQFLSNGTTAPKLRQPIGWQKGILFYYVDVFAKLYQSVQTKHFLSLCACRICISDMRAPQAWLTFSRLTS